MGMQQEAWAIVISIAVLVLASGVLWGLNRFVGKVDGGIFIAILLVPLIVYAIASGRLTEFSGPGGWGAKFRAAATSQIETSGVIEAEVLQAIPKGGLRQLPGFIERLDPELPNALTLNVGRRGYYVSNVIKEYLTTLMIAGPSTYVIFVEEGSGKFVGSANASQVLALLDNPSTGNQFMNELARGGDNAFQDMVFLVRQSLKPGETNQSALKKFLNTNADALVVVSEDGTNPVGIVERNRLMTELMVKLTIEK